MIPKPSYQQMRVNIDQYKRAGHHERMAALINGAPCQEMAALLITSDDMWTAAVYTDKDIATLLHQMNNYNVK
jgi:hypothetical protein